MIKGNSYIFVFSVLVLLIIVVVSTTTMIIKTLLAVITIAFLFPIIRKILLFFFIKFLLSGVNSFHSFSNRFIILDFQLQDYTLPNEIFSIKNDKISCFSIQFCFQICEIFGCKFEIFKK